MSNFQNIILVFILCVALPVLCEHQDVGEINIFDVEGACPEPSARNNASVTTCPVSDSVSPCFDDNQCKIGSKCCPSEGCAVNHCLDLTHGTVSQPKPSSIAKVSSRRWNRQVVRRCVECSCVRSCRTNADCKHGRRRRCYHNSCSSYCIRG